MGNDHICKMMGMGTVKLIALGALDSNGYKIVLEEGMLKVLLGALVVIRGMKEGNHYFFKGCMVSGIVSTKESDSMRL